MSIEDMLEEIRKMQAALTRFKSEVLRLQAQAQAHTTGVVYSVKPEQWFGKAQDANPAAFEDQHG